MTEMKTRVAIDTYVNSAKPSVNYQQASRLGVKGTEQYAYVYFSRPFPLGATIVSAKLTLQTYAMSGTGSRTFSIRRTGARTTLSRLNWTTRPALFETDIATQTKTGALPGGTEWEFDVTAQMQKVSAGGKWYGFHISTNSTAQHWVYGEENSARGPRLEVEWSDAPSEPESLVPGGNLTVGTQKPTLRFDYVDLGGNTDLDSVQVQINSTNVFTAPSFDSGWKDATVPELDLATTLYTGLPADGTSVWWGVRVKDGAGLESSWSDAEQMRYVERALVSITSPTTQFYDTSQTVTWTVTGGTQSAYQVVVVHPTNPDINIWDSGKVTSTQTSLTIPNGVIRWDDLSYRFIVRVWDSISRASTPGSPAYRQQSVTSLYDKDATVPEVIGLTLTQESPTPLVTLSWDYGSLPDAWSISRNSEVVARLDSDDVPVIGGKYVWTDRHALPHRENTYFVRPVVNGRTAYGSAGKKITPRHSGIWILSDTGYLCVMGQDSGSFEMTEHATEHEVLGSTKSTIINQGIGGYKGEMTGQLVSDIPGLNWSASAWKNRFHSFREQASQGKTFRLVVADMNIPVKLGRMVVSPRPEEEIMFDVSFTFWQDGELPFDSP